MTPKEYKYKDRLKGIIEVAEAEKRILSRSFALAGRRFNVGDIIKNGFESPMKVEKVRWTYGTHGGLPYCVYVGETLTKALNPRKNPEEAKFHDIDNNNSSITKIK